MSLTKTPATNPDDTKDAAVKLADRIGDKKAADYLKGLEVRDGKDGKH